MIFNKILPHLLLILSTITLTLAQCDLNLTQYANDPTILSTLNGILRGECSKIEINDPQNSNLTGYVFSWKGVPYAEAPINQLRFKKPVPVQNWTDVKNATAWSKKCMQTGFGNAPDPNVSEDCLYLNIFIPANLYLNFTLGKGPKIPIYVFIHGGRFILGSGADNDPSISTVLSNVIYITINYRLGPFGFMHLANSSISGNQGFLDQHLALKWIYENADRFGGDKTKITLGGQSAGSFSTSYHLVYRPSWPYFRSVIMQSGTLLYSTMELYSSKELTTRTKSILANTGCNYDSFNNQDEFLSCVQNLNAQSILSETSKYESSVLLNATSLASELNPVFQLVLDGVEFKEPIRDTIKKRDLKKANVLGGFTSHEASFLLSTSGRFPSTNQSDPFADLDSLKNFVNDFYYYYPRYPTKSNETFVKNLVDTYISNVTNITNYIPLLVQMLSEQVFICPIINLEEIMTLLSNKVYMYTFEHRKPTSRYAKIYGAVHGDDVDYVFGKPMSKDSFMSPFGPVSPSTQYADEDRVLSKQMITYWSNFIKTTNPNQGEQVVEINWPTYNKNENRLLGWFYDIYNFFISLFSSLFSRLNGLKYIENQHLVIKARNLNVTNVFLFENKYPRRCDFWRSFENL